VSGKEEFGRVYDEHVWDVYGFFGYRVGSREEAEDLTQITFERAVKAWSRFDRRRASPRTWLMAIASNLLFDHNRRRDAAPTDAASDESLDAHPAPDSERELGISSQLEAALAHLGDRERELIALRFGGDLSGPEIAELTGLSLANVQQILSRSLRRLRSELERSGRESSAQKAVRQTGRR
jgi:RNA polymerase sigma-70 factor, ECF subfamily